MHVAVLQFASSRDRAENRSVISDGLSQLSPGAWDLVVLPEAAMRDFGPPDDDLRPDAEPVYADRATDAETRDDRFAAMLGAESARLQSTIVAGMFERTDNLPYNTLLLAGPDSSVVPAYRKIHLYDSFGYRESERMAAGPIEPAVVSVAGTPVGLMTCYDLRFPELARSLVDAGAEVLIVPTAWVAGEGKLDHWRTLVKARAIENTVDVVGAAQCGDRYTGHSTVVSAAGVVVTEADNEPGIVTATLSAEDRQAARRRNPSLTNRRMGR